MVKQEERLVIMSGARPPSGFQDAQNLPPPLKLVWMEVHGREDGKEGEAVFLLLVRKWEKVIRYAWCSRPLRCSESYSSCRKRENLYSTYHRILSESHLYPPKSSVYYLTSSYSHLVDRIGRNYSTRNVKKKKMSNCKEHDYACTNEGGFRIPPD
jgi:hypothetical protein